MNRSSEARKFMHEKTTEASFSLHLPLAHCALLMSAFASTAKSIPRYIMSILLADLASYGAYPKSLKVGYRCNEYSIRR